MQFLLDLFEKHLNIRDKILQPKKINMLLILMHSQGGPMQNLRFSEVIETAIQREEAAYAFYMDLFNQIEDNSVKDTLHWIAGEEKKHKEFLVKYRDGQLAADTLEMKKVVHYQVAEHLNEPAVEKEMRSEDVFLVASHRELRSYAFYSDLAGMHPSGELKDILLKMAQEELKHKEKMEYLYANTAFPQTDGG